ncbi:MAG TPA: hypothetical protein ENH07_07280 [Nitrospirae bacterium]|nr:hypothetical protein BMS3Bbin05_00042 [bacterium BMS3Bbin05]HDO22592.1 hypothetical protein [Nitrospirota bacterium]HDO36081.1 hypothetical protein [Nitrospirota bacterium]HDZ88919.1 hypothetical protein [Nitrospirota bacterium]
MQIVRDKLWTWYLPDTERSIDRDEWLESGGKWIIFDSKSRIEELADRLKPLIDSGEIESAKSWNGDPGAINVYSLDRDREKNRKILESLGAGDTRVWEYDYAWCKNIKHPASFVFSWSSKFRTILKSYGVKGTLGLVRDILQG